MSIDLLRCGWCGGNLPGEMLNAGWRECPQCGREMRLDRFALHPTAAFPTRDAPAEEGASCFYHAERAAQASCERCGRFVCSLCHLQTHHTRYCLPCVEEMRQAPAPDDRWFHYYSSRPDRGLWLLTPLALVTGCLVQPIIIGAALYLLFSKKTSPDVPRSSLVLLVVANVLLPLLLLGLFMLPGLLAGA